MDKSFFRSAQGANRKRAGDISHPPIVIRQLLATLLVFSLAAVGFYFLYYYFTKEVSAQVAAGAILIAIIPGVLAYFLASRKQSTAAGLMVVMSLAVAFSGNELAWRGLTFYHLFAGLMVIVLAGWISLPQKRAPWLVIALVYGIGLLWINNNEPFQRADASFSFELHAFALGINILMVLALFAILFQSYQPRSIRLGLLLAFVLLVLLPGAAGMAVSGVLGTQGAIRQVVRQLDSVSAVKEAEIQSWVNSMRTNLILAVPPSDQLWQIETILPGGSDSDKVFRQVTYDRLLGWFNLVIEQSGLFDEIFLMDPEGNVALSTDQTQVGTNKSSRAYFKNGLESFYINPAYLSPTLGVLSIVSSMPVTNENGEIIAILAGRAKLAKLNEIMLERTGLGITGETYLVSFSHFLLSGSRFEGYEIGESILFSPAINAAIEQGASGSGVYPGYRDSVVIGVYRWFPDLQMVLVAEQERAEALRPTYQSLLLNLGIGFGAVILAIFTGIFVSRQFTGALANLANTAEQIAAGNLGLTARIERRDEIGALAQAFNSMTSQLRALVTSLEQRVAERTRALEQKSIQLQVAAEVARDATAIRELNEVLSHAVNLVRDRFGYYHAGIFLVDERGEYAVLRAATGEAGERMMELGHRLKVGETGMVGYVSQTGKPRLAQDVQADPTHYKNPLLPETNSEGVLPLKSGEKVIGALDVQSKETNAFDDETVGVLQILADQLAVAIESARLLEETQASLHELEAVYAKYTRDSWSKVDRYIGAVQGYQLKGLDVRAIPEEAEMAPEVTRAVKEEQTIIQVEEQANGGLEFSNVAIPMKLRGQVMGVIRLRIASKYLVPDLLATYEEIGNRLALVLENARLLQEAQRLAAREQRVNTISTQLRRSVDLDTVLKNTVQELARALGSSRTFIQIGIQPQDEAAKVKVDG